MSIGNLFVSQLIFASIVLNISYLDGQKRPKVYPFIFIMCSECGKNDCFFVQTISLKLLKA